jgi:hypothetical protein
VEVTPSHPLKPRSTPSAPPILIDLATYSNDENEVHKSYNKHDDNPDNDPDDERISKLDNDSNNDSSFDSFDLNDPNVFNLEKREKYKAKRIQTVQDWIEYKQFERELAEHEKAKCKQAKCQQAKRKHQSDDDPDSTSIEEFDDTELLTSSTAVTHNNIPTPPQVHKLFTRTVKKKKMIQGKTAVETMTTVKDLISIRKKMAADRMEIMKIREYRLELESQIATEQARQNRQLIKVMMARIMGTMNSGMNSLNSKADEGTDWLLQVAEEYYE